MHSRYRRQADNISWLMRNFAMQLQRSAKTATDFNSIHCKLLSIVSVYGTRSEDKGCICKYRCPKIILLGRNGRLMLVLRNYLFTYAGGLEPTNSRTRIAIRLCRFHLSTATATNRPPTNSMLASCIDKSTSTVTARVHRWKLRQVKISTYVSIFICPISYALACDRLTSLRLSVCGHSYGRISWSIFTKFGT